MISNPKIASAPVALALAVVLAGGFARSLRANDETNKPALAYPKIETD